MKSLSTKAQQSCVDIYNDFTEEEAKLQTKSIYIAWCTGMEIVERLKNCYQQEYRGD